MVIYRKLLRNICSNKVIFTSTQHGGIGQKQQNVRSLSVSSIRRALLSPQEITDILRENEFTNEVNIGPVKYYETNQVASNSPIEDYTAEVKCTFTSGAMFGVFDGHGGRLCANVTSRRLFQYMAACLLPQDVLYKYISSNDHTPLVEYYDIKKAKIEFLPDLGKLYTKSFHTYLKSLASYTAGNRMNVEHLFEYAFTYFDRDLSYEVLEIFDNTKKIERRLLDIAVSGCVVCAAYIDEHDLYIANTGDCNAVMGSVSEDNELVAKKLCYEHTVENTAELNRVLRAHKNERDTVIMADRLLGQLLPLRAFGDYRYKWDIETLEKLVVPELGDVIPPNYLTPPYLTATPEIFTYKLTPKDKFLVLATDGLWEILSPHEVVSLVGEHMLGKASFTPINFQNRIMNLGAIMDILEERQALLQHKPIDRNASTHLIRHAFGSTDTGIISNHKLSRLLSMPPKTSRRFRDDISITIIYFNSDYLQSQSE